MDDNLKLLPPSAFQFTTQNATRKENPSSAAATVNPALHYGARYSQYASPAMLPQYNQLHTRTVGYHVTPTAGPQLNKQQKDVPSPRELEMSEKVLVLEEQLLRRSNAYKEQMTKLEAEMHLILEQQQQTNTEHNEQIKRYESVLKERDTQLDQMKRYVTDHSTPSTQMVKRQLDGLQNQVQTLERQKKELENNVELLNIRLKSHDQIQTIHDTEISEAGEVGQEKKRQILLKRWRTKVYELLVQIQSAEFVHKKDQQMQKQQLADIEKASDGLKHQMALLQCVADDKQASIDLQQQQNKKLEFELQSLETLAVDIDNKNKEYQQVINSLVDFANSMYASFMVKEEQYQKMADSLQQYSQRITFATGRMELVQSQIARRDTLLRIEMQGAAAKEEKPEIQQQDCESSETLQQEVERLIKERDALSKQSKQDMLTLEQKLLEARSSTDHQIAELQEQTKDLQDNLQIQTIDLEAALETIDLNTKEKADLQETVNKLQTRLEEIQSNVQQEIARSYEVEQQEHRQALAELQHKLDESSREQSKTVVSLRQLERQRDRERERVNEQITSIEQNYKQHINKLDNKLKALEKERNLLMTTLRHEGLVGKHRATRQSPVTWQEQHSPRDTMFDSNGDMTAERTAADTVNSQQLEEHVVENVSLNFSDESQGHAELTFVKETDSIVTEPTQASLDMAGVLEEVKQLSEDVMGDLSLDSSDEDDN